jgi:peptidoglycan/LPS O-acetylase OafA/YrhL
MENPPAALQLIVREPAREPPSSSSDPALQAILRSSYLPALDGLRALAALLVIFYHFQIGRKVGHWGNLGVEMFFTLSGFLITWLLLREQEQHGAINLGQFYIRRSLRIFPAFYIFGLLSLGLLLLNGLEVRWAAFLAAFFYVSNIYDALGYPYQRFLGHTWSLAVEEQFYLLWPLMLLMLLLCRRNTRYMTNVLIAIIGSVWGYRAWLVLTLGASRDFLYACPHMRWDQLMTGCLLAVLLKREACSGLWRRLCSCSLLPVLTLILLGTSAYLQVISEYTYTYLVGFAIDPVLTAILIVQLMCLHNRVPWRWLNWRSVQYLGQISYSLYLYHVLLMPAAVHTLLARYVRWWQLEFVVKLGITILLASASFWLVERPCLKLKRTFA